MKRKIITISLLFIIFNSVYAQVIIIHNVQGNSINQGKLTTFSAIAFENTKVLAVGNSKEIKKSFPHARLIDGKGNSILPGLHDAHAHIMPLSRLQNQVDLSGITTLKDSLQKIKDFANNNPDIDWILGRGWNQVLWKGKQFPNKADLDSLNIDRPIWLKRIDGHAAWANSLAMQIAATTSIEKDIEGGEIIVDNKGVQTGVFINNAMNLIQSKVPQESPFDTIDTMLGGLSYLASLGLTSVDDAGIKYQTYNAYKLLAKNKLIPIRVNAMIASGDNDLAQMLKKPVHDKNGFLQIHTIKYVFDGALGSRGAAMLAPYSDRHDTLGLIVQSQDFIEKTMYANAPQGWQSAIHSIGDRANRMALMLMADKRALTKINRNRIEHAQVVNVNDLHLFKKHNVIASMQPTHATSDMNMAEDRVGQERLKGAYAWQTLINDGTLIASGSDFPIELPNPFYGLHAAVTRQNRNNQPKGGWIPSEKMTLEQALASFTINAAYANRRDKELGSLEAGKLADFILVNQNIFNIKPESIWKTKVLQTWVGGEKIFDKTLENE